VFRILAVQRQVALAFGERIVDHGARKTQALVFAVGGANRQAGFDAMFVGIGESDLFEDAIYGRFDLFDVGWGQRFILAPGFPGVNRFKVFGQGGPA
jgi:hypothetical protein